MNTETAHTTQHNYEHFLAYSGLDHSPILQYAYFHGADIGMDKPAEGLTPVIGTWISHERDPHCIGCYVVEWKGGELIATCNECGVQVDLLEQLATRAKP